MRLGFERIPHRRPGERPTNNGSMDGSIHRLQWVGQERRTTTLESFVPWFGEDRSARPRAVCPDKRKDCVQVVREAASQARHLPDRLHLVPAFTRRAEPWSPGKAHHGPAAREPPGQPGGHCHRAIDPSAGQLVRERTLADPIQTNGSVVAPSAAGPVFIDDDHGASARSKTPMGSCPGDAA